MSRCTTETRERVLYAACELIAVHGLHATTMQMICERANANIAAVNYYFGSKEQLYESVWERACAEADALYGFAKVPGISPEEYLRSYLGARLRSIMDDGPGGWLPRIIFHAFSENKDGIESFFHKHLLPRRQDIKDAVRELLGPSATELQVRCCVSNIQSLYIQMNVWHRRGHGLFQADGIRKDEFETVLAQVQEFAIGGIRHLRQLIDNGQN